MDFKLKSGLYTGAGYLQAGTLYNAEEKGIDEKTVNAWIEQGVAEEGQSANDKGQASTQQNDNLTPPNDGQDPDENKGDDQTTLDDEKTDNNEDENPDGKQPDETNVLDFDNMEYADLRAEAKNREIKGYHQMKAEELAEALKAHEEQKEG